MIAMTHKGFDVHLSIHAKDPNDSLGIDQGWSVHRFDALFSGEVIGFLKVENIYSDSVSDEQLVGSRPHWRFGADRYISEYKRNHFNRPQVAYVSTHPDYVRKGIATLLYSVAAKWLAREKNLPLWASTIRSNEARAVWDNMAKLGLPVVNRSVPWDNKVFVPVMDFRNKNSLPQKR